MRRISFGAVRCERLVHLGLYEKDHGEAKYQLQFHEDAKDLVHVRIQSRHKRSTQYLVWIQYDKKTVTGWCCSCPSGLRTAGCCAHIASVIWFLSLARHNAATFLKGKKDWASFMLDARDQDQEEGDEEDNSEEE